MTMTYRTAPALLLTSAPLFADTGATLVSVSFILILLVVIAILVFTLILANRRNAEQLLAHQEALEKVRNEAIEAERAKDTFLANVSHETRTPMTAIIGLSHILLQSDLNKTQKNNVSKIKRSAEHLLAITNDILDFSKIEAGKLEITNSNFESSDFFTNLVDIVGVQALEKRLDLIFDISPQFPTTLIGDSLRISQVLINLMNNAIKFTDKGEVILRVSVASRHGDTCDILFEVSDTGIGLTETQIEKLFQAFDQADNKISRKYGGTGLGLAISKELVEKMGGHLEIKSRFRMGSTFYFTLPLTMCSNTTANIYSRMKRLLHNKTVLILEGNAYTAQLLSDTLEHYGALPKITTSVDALYLQLQETHYDAIFIDEYNASKLRAVGLINSKSNAIVLLKYEAAAYLINNQINIDTVLIKPFTHQSFLHAMSEIFDTSIALNKVKQVETSFNDILVLQGSKILLAEDNEGNRMVVEGLMEGSGIEIITVTNGQKAVEIVLSDTHEFELILMDINMPVMDGYAAASMIREYQKYDNIPIVAMTANITESDIGKSKSIGMQAHLSKPINISNFYKTLLQFIPAKVSPDEITLTAETAPQNSAKPELASLPNIDTEDGLLRLNGNVEAYQNVLYKFADMFQNADEALTAIVQNNDYGEGRALAHNLKGLSGNIGAKKIYALAQELEETFRDGEGEFSALIRAIRSQLNPLIKAIYTLKEEQAAAVSADRVFISAEHMDLLLGKLYLNAKKKKAHEIKDLCKEIENYAWPQEHHNSIHAILEQAKSYQFDKVNQTIESILPEIKTLQE